MKPLLTFPTPNRHIDRYLETRLNNKPIVNAWNEWDELEEVVVGNADNACFEPTEPGSHPKLRDSSMADIVPFPSGANPLCS